MTMRVLFSSWACGGHFAPLVPLGWALRAAGHEVLVACHPGQADQVLRAGLPALPVGPDVDTVELMRRTRGTGPARGYPGMVRIAVAVADLIADELVEFCQRWRPDLVVYEAASMTGPLVARVLGVPAVRQLWTTDFTAPVNGFPATVTGPLPNRFGVDGFDTAGTLTLDPCPPRLQVRDDLPRQPVRYVPYNGPAVLPGWLRRPRAHRRICVTWGTSLGLLGLDRMRHVPRIVRALGGLDAELVVAVADGHRKLFTGMPDSVVALGPVPLHLLLPTCDVIVHQGGGGTMMTAALAGIPQVIVPSIPDQVFNAGHLAATGAGVHVRGHDEVAAQVRDVLTGPRYRLGAHRLRAELRDRPSPAAVVPVLERLAVDWATAGLRPLRPARGSGRGTSAMAVTLAS
jgi:UDP:flavonoid glycosyltransferase YjiC (YdhE family)